MQDAVTTYFTGEKHAISGIALGLLVHAAVLLAFDVIAERRGATYLARLEARTE